MVIAVTSSKFGSGHSAHICPLEWILMMQERVEHDYRVTAWWTSGRTGIAKSDSAPNAIHFTAPKNFGGLEGRWTPEELLLASIAACYTTTLRSIASSAHTDFTDLEVEASGTIKNRFRVFLYSNRNSTHSKDRQHQPA